MPTARHCLTGQCQQRQDNGHLRLWLLFHVNPSKPVLHGQNLLFLYSASYIIACVKCRPSTPEVQLKLARGITVSDPGSAAAAAAAGGAVLPGAKKHGRFTYVEGSSRYVGPDLVSGEPAAQRAAAGDSASAAAGMAAAAAAGASGGVAPSRGCELLKQRSVSSPDMALLISMQGMPAGSSISSSASGTLGGATGSVLIEAPVSPMSPVSGKSAASSTAGLRGSSAAAAAAQHAASSGLVATAAGSIGSPTQQQQHVSQQTVNSNGAGTSSPQQQHTQADAGLGTPRRPSSPSAGSSGSGLFSKLLPHKGAEAHSPRRSQSPLPQHGSHADGDHLHESHHLQHKIAGFFSHHGLGKGSKGTSPFDSRDASPQVSRQQQHGVQDAGASGHGTSRAGAAAAAAAAGAGYGGSCSSAASTGPSLSRSGNALQDIYPENYGVKDSRSHSPRAGAGRAAAGGKEHAGAGHFWQHVKEACAETASDVAHIFKSRSGGSLHQQADRSHSRSPERPSHQQQQPTSPPSPKPPVSPMQQQQPAAAGDSDSRQQQSDQAATAPNVSRPSSSSGTADGSNVAVAAVAAAALPAGRVGSSSNLVRLGSRGSIPAVSLSDLPSGGSSSSSKPPRYQQPPARAASREQLTRQPSQEQQQQQHQQQQVMRQPFPEQQQQQQVVVRQPSFFEQQQQLVSEPQVNLKQQLLEQQQQEVQHELAVMQQQQGVTQDDVRAAQASVHSLAAAAEAVGQATAAAAVLSGPEPASPPPVGKGAPVGTTAHQAAQSSGSSSAVTAMQYPTLAELWSLVPEEDEEAAVGAGAAVVGLTELGSRELSFAPGSGDVKRSSMGDSSAGDSSSAARSAAGGVLSYPISSPEPQQQELGQESSVTFPVAAERTSSGGGSSQQAPTQQQQLASLGEAEQQQQRGRQGSPAAAMAASDPQKQQQRSVSEPRSAHTSASPSRRHKGRFTITET